MSMRRVEYVINGLFIFPFRRQKRENKLSEGTWTRWISKGKLNFSKSGADTRRYTFRENVSHVSSAKKKITSWKFMCLPQ